MRRLAAALLLLIAAAASAVQAAGDARPALHSLMADDARLQSAGWRLVQANAPFCADARPGVGLVLLDAAGFADPPAIRQALGLSGDFAVDAAAKDSPAERAGIKAGDEVLAVAGLRLSDQPPAGPRDYRRLAALHDAIDRQLTESGKLVLTLRGRVVAVAGEPVCPSRFELSEERPRADADGTRVVVGRKALIENADEGEFAALVAHELAHNLLRHRRRLDAEGRSAANVAATEREADRLSVWLLANAGYDPEAAVRFAGKYLRAIDQGLFRAPTHDGWRDRQALIRKEIDGLRAARNDSPNGPLDWRKHFSP